MKLLPWIFIIKLIANSNIVKNIIRNRSLRKRDKKKQDKTYTLMELDPNLG